MRGHFDGTVSWSARRRLALTNDCQIAHHVSELAARFVSPALWGAGGPYMLSIAVQRSPDTRTGVR